jgi:hypothetical protein
MDRTQKKIPENTEKKQESTRYKKGQSGNPAGRPRGSRNKATLASEILLEGDAENITRKLIELALDGNMMAIKLCINLYHQARKGRLINLRLPTLKSPKDSTRAVAGIFKATISGEITTSEGEGLSNIVADYNKCYELQEMDERLREVEEAQNNYEAEL